MAEALGNSDDSDVVLGMSFASFDGTQVTILASDTSATRIPGYSSVEVVLVTIAQRQDYARVQSAHTSFCGPDDHDATSDSPFASVRLLAARWLDGLPRGIW